MSCTSSKQLRIFNQISFRLERLYYCAGGLSDSDLNEIDDLEYDEIHEFEDKDEVICTNFGKVPSPPPHVPPSEETITSYIAKF